MNTPAPTPSTAAARTAPLTRLGPGGDALAALSAALAADRPIGYSVNLARLTGDVKAALLLSQLLYWTRVGVEVEANGGWVLKTRQQWSAETALSRYEQQSARALLVKQGLIEESRQGTPARLAFRVVLDRLGLALSRLLRSEPVQWTLFDVRSNAQQVRALLGRNLAFYRQLARLTQSVSTAVFLSKALSVQRALANAQAQKQAKAKQATHSLELDWFGISPRQWTLETGLTAAQIRESKQKLCQQDYLQQAVQEYPRRRYYLRINVQVLTQRLMHLTLGQQQQNKTSLLGLLAGPQAARYAKPGHADLDARTKCPTNTPATQAADASTDDAWPKWPTVSLGDTRPNWPSSDAEGGQTLGFDPQNSSLAKSHFLVGGFSHVKSADFLGLDAKPAQAQDGFSTSVGGFSQQDRLVLAPLHARAWILTTNKTTPTPARPLPTTLAALAADRDGGGGGVLQSNPKPKQSPAFTPAPAPTPVPAPSSVLEPPWWHLLHWPGRLDEPDRLAAQRVLRASALMHSGPERVQLVLDEWAASLAAGKVHNAVAYLGSLLRKEAAGALTLVLAHQWQARRQAANERRAAQGAGEGTGEAAPVPASAPASIPAPIPVLAALTPSPPALSGLSAQLWQRCLDELALHIPEQQVRVWIKPLQVAVDLEQKTLYLAAPSFKIAYVRQTYAPSIRQQINQLALALLGYEMKCAFVTQLPVLHLDSKPHSNTP